MTHLATLTLRNTYDLYRDGDGVYVEQTDRRGQRYGATVSVATLRHLQNALVGREVGSQDAADTLELVAEAFDLPYHYGHKLRFYAQAALLSLVATDRAAMRKEGRAYRYAVAA